MIDRFAKILFFLLAISLGKASYALDLLMPVACDYGNDCIIASYFDHDYKEGSFADRSCATLSSDNHKTTDFRLMNTTQMREGVNVLAADSGVVRQVRDGAIDVSIDMAGVEAVRGKECGNGVNIEHKRGFVTQYCHLKQGSIAVKVGDKVEKGQLIGQVGMSGLSAFPYLEFTVLLHGQAVDPFTGADPITGNTLVSCESLDIYPLWDRKTEKKLKYISTKLLSSGFAEKVPNAQSARDGKFSKTRLSNNIKLLVFWADIFGLQAGDELKLTIFGPEGNVISSESRKIADTKSGLFQFLGKKSDTENWPEGIYRGKIELLRKDNDDAVAVINVTSAVELVNAELYKKELSAKAHKKGS